MFEKKLDIKDIHKFIVDFNTEFDTVPNAGFLAGYFKVSKRAIYNKLIFLEKLGYIERVKKNKYNTTYKIK